MGPQRRYLPGLAGEDRLSRVPPAQRRRDRRIHRCRSCTLVSRDKSTEHFIGLRTWFERVKSARANSRSRSHDDHAGLVFIGRIRSPGPRVSRRRVRGVTMAGLPARDFRALGAGAEGGRFLQQSRSDLLAASVAPRSRAAKPEEQQIDPWHVFASLAGAADPIGTSTVKLVGIEGNVGWCAASIARRDAAAGYQADRCEFSPLASPQAGDFETE